MLMRLKLAALLLLTLPGLGHAACSELLDHTFRPLAKKEAVNLCSMTEGKVVLVVNTASKCGFTPQYEGLEKLYAAHKKEGLVVIGFPSNDFMGQEPGSEKEIAEFCTLTYGVKFPMFEKTTVKEGDAHPFYVGLAKVGGGYPQWNFHKYLIGRDGKMIGGFGSRVKPDDAELTKKIEAALKAKG
jgi:glutathione peroxidase